jgi:DNA-damage-inducible protein J
MTTAFNVFARAVVRSRRIPFEIALDIPNAETIAAINEVREAKLNPNQKLYSSFSELLKEVEADV